MHGLGAASEQRPCSRGGDAVRLDASGRHGYRGAVGRPRMSSACRSNRSGFMVWSTTRAGFSVRTVPASASKGVSAPRKVTLPDQLGHLSDASLIRAGVQAEPTR